MTQFNLFPSATPAKPVVVTQPKTPFNPSTAFLGAARRDRGHQQVLAVDPDVAARLRVALQFILVGRTTITSDDLHAYLDLTPGDIRRQLVTDHPNIMGATFRAVAQAGLLRDSGRTIKTARVSGQGRRLTVWQVVKETT